MTVSAETITTVEDTLRQMRRTDKMWLRAKIEDSTLHPIVWLVLSGLLALAWLIEPETRDSPTAISLLMYVRLVPMFVLGGAIWGRAGAGAVLGTLVYFALMWAESMSALMWDVPLARLTKPPLRHADGVATALYLFALFGLIACGAATFVLRRNSLGVSRRYAHFFLQLLAAAQVALIVELAYIGISSTLGWDFKGNAPPAHRHGRMTTTSAVTFER